VAENADRAADEIVNRYNRLNPHPDNWIMSGSWSPGEPLRRAMEADQARNRVYDAYQDEKASQVRFGRRVAGFSPAAMLAQAIEDEAESGISHYEKFVSAARRYRQQLAGYLDSKYPLDKVNPVNREKTDVARMKLDFVQSRNSRTARLRWPKRPACASLCRGSCVLVIALFAANSLLSAIVR
jgi:hypothetical protein